MTRDSERPLDVSFEAGLHEAEPQDDSPLHGFRGDAAEPAAFRRPLAIALSREAGSRGGSIAKRVGARLGWEVYTQEMLEVFSQDASLRQNLVSQLPADAVERVEERLQELLEAQSVSRHPQVLDLSRLILLLASQGEVVLLGRGAGCVLAAETTVNVRVVAPVADRVAYLSQILRVTEEEATEQVRRRDHRRSEFLVTHYHRKPADVHQYDLVLNSRLLGETTCADLIVAAAKAKMGAVAADLG